MFLNYTEQFGDIWLCMWSGTVCDVQNFEEYPEHRTNFFLLLQAVNSHCFSGTSSLIAALTFLLSY